MKKALRRTKTLKKQRKKLQLFFVWTLLHGEKNFINKKGLFYAKFFEFEEFSMVPFFVVASSLSIIYCGKGIKCTKAKDQHRAYCPIVYTMPDYEKTEYGPL